MPLLSRIALLIGAALCSLFIAGIGGEFSRIVEPETYSIGTSASWLLVGALVASPMWVPTVFPMRFPWAFMACRWVSAVAVLFLGWSFFGTLLYNIKRITSGLDATPSAMAQGAGLALVCLVCSGILVWPEVGRHLKRCARAFKRRH